MYWVHRFGRGYAGVYIGLDEIGLKAACYLLEKRNCLTTGWNCLSNTADIDYDKDIVDAVEKGNADAVSKLMPKKKLHKDWAKPINKSIAANLVNFTKMKINDIVVVLPYETKDINNYFIVKIKSDAKSILKSPADMTQAFTIDGKDFTFDSNSGWNELDIGFFHEVEVLVKVFPRDIMADMFKHFIRTNAPINDNSKIQYIESLIPKTKL